MWEGIYWIELITKEHEQHMLDLNQFNNFQIRECMENRIINLQELFGFEDYVTEYNFLWTDPWLLNIFVSTQISFWLTQIVVRPRILIDLPPQNTCRTGIYW